jgi:hypothetical protein
VPGIVRSTLLWRRSSAPHRRPLNFPLFFDSSKLSQDCYKCKALEIRPTGEEGLDFFRVRVTREETHMTKKLVIIGSLAALFLTVAVAVAQQDKSKRPSPPAQATWDLGGGKSVTIDYSSPRAKGRKIYGELVPFDKVWRTGANEATTLTTAADLNIGGTTVPAGTYTLFTIPNKDKWTLIISKKTGEWGTAYPGQADDLARVDMKAFALPSPVENFTIAFEKSAGGAMLNIDWESTRASVAVSKK